MATNESEGRPGWQIWLKRLGLTGFLFFLVKGLLWLTVPALLLYFGLHP